MITNPLYDSKLLKSFIKELGAQNTTNYHVMVG